MIPHNLILSQTELARQIFDLRMQAPELARMALPGQFVNLYCADRSHLLPRPISLAGIDREQGVVRLVYRVQGYGTHSFSHMHAGDQISLRGPFGNGFPIEEAAEKNVILLGGGLGIPPLLAVAEAFSHLPEGKRPISVRVLLGYRNKELFLAKEFAALGEVHLATEDGSAGRAGTVLDLLTATWKDSTTDDRTERLLFACGPLPMLRAVQTFSIEQHSRAWLSLEERMACGIGACLACTCKTADVDAHTGVHNRRVCKDGPVFPADEIVL